MMREYLGDSVYIQTDDASEHGLILTTEDGLRVTNQIYLEPEVYAALLAFVERRKPQQERTAGDVCADTQKDRG